MSVRRKPRDVVVTIGSLDGSGLGAACHDQKPISVRNALPGESVQARILKRRGGRRYADAVELLSAASADRRLAACAHFPRCGGCSLHHLDYAAQLRLKHNLLADELSRHDVFPNIWREPVSVGRLGYRRKARLGVRKVGDQVLVGFRESFSSRVARLETCVVLTPELARLIAPLRATIAQLSGADRIPQIEMAQGDDRIAILVRHLDDLTGDDRRLWLGFQHTFDVQVLLQPGGYDRVVALDGSAISLLGYQIQECGLHLLFDPRQFTQVNAAMNLELISRTLCLLGELAGKRVIDLFCGIGNFSLPLGRRGAVVLGLEVDAGSVEMARLNAQRNGLHGMTFDIADLYDTPDTLPEADVLVLDPPRSGAGPNLERWLAQSKCGQLVYVSCNAQTFAADAARICAAGFCLLEAGAFDMFPHTAHVESMGYFERQGD